MRDKIGSEERFLELIHDEEFYMDNVPEGLLEMVDEIPTIREDYLKKAKEDEITYRTLFYLNYSVGTDLNKCYEYFYNWLKYSSLKYKPEDGDGWFEIVDILSVSILYKSRLNEFSEYLKPLVEKWESREKYILNELYRYLFNEDLYKDAGKTKAVYMEKIFNSKDINIVKESLKKEWYKFHRDAYWYDTHNLENNCYQGYWAWDIGAAVKILGLDDSELKDCKYYPYDLVHYCD